MNLALLPLLLITLFSPPSGRPPTGPLGRYEPRIYDIRFEVTVSTASLPDAYQKGYQIGQAMHLVDTPIVMPVIFSGTFSKVDPDSLAARIWYSNREDLGLNQRSRVDEGYPFHTHLAVMPIPEFRGKSLRWQLGFRTKVWSSRVDDTRAAQIPWPREWPKEVQDGLQPQLYIESDNPGFAQAVENVSKGSLRLVPPYLAAKDLVRYCINTIQVSGDGLDKRDLGMLHGMEVVGAAQTAADQRGGPHDLVCICVAMLRAANIPARPVIGIYRNKRDRVTFVSWAEFFLPECGWIPFDPVELRGKGIRNKDVRLPWKDFGTMDDLNRRIPLSYHFIPAASVQSPQAPAVWGCPASANAARQFSSITSQ